MKKPTLCLSLFLSALACSAAPPTEESIRSLFAVMKTESLLESVYASMEPAVRQGLQQATQGKELTAEQRAIFERAPQRMSEVLRRELSWATIEPIQVAIYRESFDQAEIDGLLAFYRSPVGQSYVNKLPLFTRSTMAAMQSHMQEAMPRINAEMRAIFSEPKLPPPK